MWPSANKKFMPLKTRSNMMASADGLSGACRAMTAEQQLLEAMQQDPTQ